MKSQSQRPLFTQHEQTSVLPAGFEHAIPAIERPQVYAVKLSATGSALYWLYRLIYEERWEVISTQNICSDFIIFRLNTKQLAARNIPLLGYTSLPSLWGIPVSLKDLFFSGAAENINKSVLLKVIIRQSYTT